MDVVRNDKHMNFDSVRNGDLTSPKLCVNYFSVMSHDAGHGKWMLYCGRVNGVSCVLVENFESWR